jgi:hypothetical protein
MLVGSSAMFLSSVRDKQVCSSTRPKAAWDRELEIVRRSGDIRKRTSIVALVDSAFNADANNLANKGRR